MSGWLRYFVLRAQASTGFSSPIVVWAVVAAVAAVVAAIFLLVAAYVWLSDVYDGLVAGLLLGALFAQIYALRQSLLLGVTPDRPNAAGVVNRVVQGVTIHRWQPAGRDVPRG